MIILLRTLEIDDEELVEGLCRRILSKQQQNGAWKLFYDEGEGNVTSTVEAYYGLLFPDCTVKKTSVFAPPKVYSRSRRFIGSKHVYENHAGTDRAISMAVLHPSAH